MINDPNLPNIAAAYIVAFGIVAAMAISIVAEHRRLTRALALVAQAKRPR